jgi:hypothetical protein
MSKFEEPISSVDRYVGGTDQNQAEAQAFMGRVFEAHELGEMERFERPKTPEELELIEIVNRETDKVREKYGLAAYRVPPENYHVISKEGAEELGVPGTYVLLKQAAVIVETDTRAEMAKRLVHETLHFKSFGSVNVDDGGLSERRMGLVSVEASQNHFDALNEAVTEELAKRVMRAVEKTPLLRSEAARLREVREIVGDDVSHIKMNPPAPDGTPNEDYFPYSYTEERQALNLIIDKLMERNPDSKLKHEGWFDLFAAGMFTGHLLEIARAVEKTFGQGAFRKLAEQKEGPALLEFVESL